MSCDTKDCLNNSIVFLEGSYNHTLIKNEDKFILTLNLSKDYQCLEKQDWYLSGIKMFFYQSIDSNLTYPFNDSLKIAIKYDILQNKKDTKSEVILNKGQLEKSNKYTIYSVAKYYLTNKKINHDSTFVLINDLKGFGIINKIPSQSLGSAE